MTPLSDHGMATPTTPASPPTSPGPASDRPGPASDRPGPASDRPGAAEALADLLAGNRRFVAGRPRYGHDFRAAAAASGDQQPYALVLGCIDSRVPLEAIFDQNFGAICVARSGAQVLDRALLGSVEFAVRQLAVPLVMVLGHERCGAIASTVEAMRSGQRPAGTLGYLVDEIAPAVTEAGGPGHPQVHSRALRRHVNRTVERLRELDGVSVVGAVYDLDSGRVDLT
jgi:carbonic anhydrase